MSSRSFRWAKADSPPSLYTFFPPVVVVGFAGAPDLESIAEGEDGTERV